MFGVQLLCAMLIFVVLRWPELPLCRAIVDAALSGVEVLRRHLSLARALLAIGFALLLFGAIWALQGDAPMFLAMILPELAGWFATFEIATLVDVAVGVGMSLLALRASGVVSHLRLRRRARRRRSIGAKRPGPSANDDDRPGAFQQAA